MTLEEIKESIEVIKAYRQRLADSVSTLLDGDIAAFDIAIEAMEREQKTGHWIEYTRVLIPEPINEWEQAWYCSECGYGNQECEDGSAWLEWKYCPNCGCRMVEPQGEVNDG